MRVGTWPSRLDASDDSAWTDLLSVATSRARRMKPADPSGLAANVFGEQVLTGVRRARTER